MRRRRSGLWLWLCSAALAVAVGACMCVCVVARRGMAWRGAALRWSRRRGDVVRLPVPASRLRSLIFLTFPHSLTSVPSLRSPPSTRSAVGRSRIFSSSSSSTDQLCLQQTHTHRYQHTHTYTDTTASTLTPVTRSRASRSSGPPYVRNFKLTACGSGGS